MFYKDRGAGVRFAKLFNKIAELFPERKLDQLQDLILGKQKKNKQNNTKKKKPRNTNIHKNKIIFWNWIFLKL